MIALVHVASWAPLDSVAAFCGWVMLLTVACKQRFLIWFRFTLSLPGALLVQQVSFPVASLLQAKAPVFLSRLEQFSAKAPTFAAARGKHAFIRRAWPSLLAKTFQERSRRSVFLCLPLAWMPEEQGSRILNKLRYNRRDTEAQHTEARHTNMAHIAAPVSPGAPRAGGPISHPSQILQA